MEKNTGSESVHARDWKQRILQRSSKLGAVRYLAWHMRAPKPPYTLSVISLSIPDLIYHVLSLSQLETIPNIPWRFDLEDFEDS